MMVVFWLLVALAAGIIEAVTVTLVSVWIALGAVAAAVAAGLGCEPLVQLLVFAVTTVVLLALTAPVCRKFRIARKIPTNADRLIGCEGIVTEDIDPVRGKGEVKVKGQAWSAQLRGADFAQTGTIVVVEEITGVHLVVRIKA